MNRARGRGGAGRALAVAVALATVAGCGGDAERAKDSSPETTTTIQATSTSTGGVATTGPGGQGTTAMVPAGGTGSGGGGMSAGRTGGPSAPTTTAGGAGAGAGSGGSGRGAATSATHPGRYRYASTGTFSIGAGGEQPRSGESVLTVDPPVGSDQHSLRQGVNRSTEQVLRFQPDGIYIVFLKVSEQGLTKEFRPSPPVLAFPFGAAPGRAWSWRMASADGQTTVEADFRAERRESVQVGPDTVPSVVVGATLSTSGDLTSKAVQTLWVAESHRLVTREESVTEGTFGGVPFRSKAREEMLSLSPS